MGRFLSVRNDAFAWLLQPEATLAARRELDRLRLPLSLADDALQEARIRAWRLGLDPDREPADSPVAVAYRMLQYAVRDLYRRADRRPLEVALDEAAPVAAVLDLTDAIEDDCRRAAHATLDAVPWAGAAALNELTFRLHHDVPFPEETPVPVGDDEQQATWAAIWLAGKVDCFPAPGGEDSPKIRRRRSRALATTAERLRDIVVTATATTGDRAPV